MALSPGTKTVLTVAAVAGVAWWFMKEAKADEGPIGPPEPQPVDPIPEPDPPAPPPPNQGKCNFLGCPGYALPSPHGSWTPTYAAIRLQQLGYNINPAAPGWTLLSDASRSKVAHFQNNYNRVAPTMSPPRPKIDADGLVGPRTARAIDLAFKEVTKRMQTWAVIVSLTP